MTGKDKERYEQWKTARPLTKCDKCESQTVIVNIPDDIYEEDYSRNIGKTFYDIRACGSKTTCFSHKKFKDRGNRGPIEREVY